MNKFTANKLLLIFQLCILICMGLFPCLASGTHYTVQSGDTLARIAKEQMGNAQLWPALAAYNNLNNPDKLRVGQALRIPDAAWIEAWQRQNPGTKTRGLYVGEMTGRISTIREEDRIKPEPPETLLKIFGADYRRKLDKGDRLIRIDTKIKPKLFVLTGWQGAGQIELLQGKYMEALARCKDEIRYYPNDTEGLKIKAFLYSRCALARIELNDFEGALKDVDMAIQLYVASDLKQSLPDCYLLRSRAKLRACLYDEALEEIDKMEYTARQENDSCRIAQSYHQRAYVNYILGNVDEAFKNLETAEQQIKFCRGLSAPFFRWELNGRQLGIYVSTGRFDLALPYLKSLLDTATGFWSTIAQKAGFDAMHSFAFGGLGYILNMIGQTEKAETIMQEGLSIAVKNSMMRETAFNLWVLGSLYRDAGDIEAAWDCYRLWEQCLEYLKEPQFEMSMNTGMADLCILRDDFSQALQYCQKALTIAESSSISIDIPFIYLLSGQALKGLKRTAEAEKTWLQALNMNIQNDNPAVYYQVQLELANLALEKGGTGKAKEHIIDAVNAVESMREALPGRDIRAAFLSDKTTVYDKAVHIAEKQGNSAWGFEMIERAKSRSFLDLMGSRAWYIADESRQKLLNSEFDKRRHLVSLQSIYDDRGGITVDYTENKTLKTKYRNARNQLKSFHDDLKKADRELASLVTTSTIPMSELQEYLDHKTVFLNYYLAENDAYCVIVSKTESKIKRLKTSQIEIAAWIHALRSDIYNRPDETILIKLSECLIDPLKTDIDKARHIIICPHKDLHHLPFEMLMDQSGTYLGQIQMTSYTPSASVLVFGLDKNRQVSGNLLAFGNPASPVKGFDDIKNAETEAHAIHNMYPEGRVFTGRKASEATFRKLAPESGIVHLAAHGVMVPHDPMASAVLLSSGDGEDGILTASDVFGLKLKAGIITLSACETAVTGGSSKKSRELDVIYRTSPGDDLIGLTRAFMFAGTPSIIASLWKVETFSTEMLMLAFYSNLSKGQGRAEALWNARKEIAAHPSFGGNPYYWAPFILMGDWR
jgi:CHAT domain-containing protein